MDSARSSRRSRTSSYRSSLDRASTPRPRTLSVSARTSSSTGSPRCTLANWQVPSFSDIDNSRAASQLDLESILQRHLGPRLPSGITTSVSHAGPQMPCRAADHVASTKAGLPELYLEKSLPPPPTPTTQRPQMDQDPKTPKMKTFMSNVSSILPKRPERRRPSGNSIDSDKTLAPAYRPEVANAEGGTRNLSIYYDPDTQRFTGSDWQSLFPGENSDPFAGVDVSAANSPRNSYRMLLKRATQKVDTLFKTARSKIPARLTVQIKPAEGKTLSEDVHVISSPFNVVHTLWEVDGSATKHSASIPEQRGPNTSRSEGHGTELHDVAISGVESNVHSLVTPDVHHRFPTKTHRLQLSGDTFTASSGENRPRTQSTGGHGPVGIWGRLRRDRGLESRPTDGPISGRENIYDTSISPLEQTHRATATPQSFTTVPRMQNTRPPAPVTPRLRIPSMTRHNRGGSSASRVDHLSLPPPSSPHRTARQADHSTVLTYRPSEEHPNRTPIPRSPNYF